MGDPFVLRIEPAFCSTAPPQSMMDSTAGSRQTSLIGPSADSWEAKPLGARIWSISCLHGLQLPAFDESIVLRANRLAAVTGPKDRSSICIRRSSQWWSHRRACLHDTDGAPYLFFDKVGVIESTSKRYLLGVVYGVRLKPFERNGWRTGAMLEADQPWELRRMAARAATRFIRLQTRWHLLHDLLANHAEPFYGVGYATAALLWGRKKSSANPLVAQKPEIGVWVLVIIA